MTFAHLTIPTRNVNQTRDFFIRVMGWKNIRMPGNIDLEAAWLEISPGQQLHILRIEDAPAPDDQEFGRHYAFFHPGSDFNALEDRVTRHGGVIVQPIRETPFQRIFFRDPNGYLFELIDQDGYQTEN